MNPQTLKAILGHSKLSMTMDLYAHVLPDKKEEEMRKSLICSEEGAKGESKVSQNGVKKPSECKKNPEPAPFAKPGIKEVAQSPSQRSGSKPFSKKWLLALLKGED